MNKRHFDIFKTFFVIGIGIIVFGIIITAIPLSNFSGSTFKLGPALCSGLLLPFFGITIIIVTQIVSINKKSDEEIENISSKVKKEMTKDSNTPKNANVTCSYCGCTSPKDTSVCPHCGAKLK